MKERTAPSSCARNVSSSAPSRTTAPGKSDENFGYTTLFDFVSLQIPNFSGCMSVNWNKLPESVHHSDPTFLQQAWYHHLDRAAAIFLLVWQELERIDQVVTPSLRCRVRSANFGISAVTAVLYDQDSVRSPPIILRTPPAALPLSVPRRDPPNVVFKRETVAMRVYTRQGDTSLTFDWHDDPLQEVRALARNIRRNTQSALVFLLHLTVAFPHLHTCPHAELTIFQ